MNVAIIDADLAGRKRHRFPNLTCMKLSGYHKEHGDAVWLKTDYYNLDTYDKVYIAKVFTDTPVDEKALKMPNVTFGGTGFFYDKAQPLPSEIEHHMPDYHLYDRWAIHQKPSEIKYYADYSIGFLTRGCFRHCSFCVNRRSNAVRLHSPLEEFFDPMRKKIALLDDNFLGSPDWKRLLLELQATNKPFTFRQGLDVRLLDDEKAELLFKSKYAGDFYFAFDNIEDAPLIEEQLQLIRKYTKRNCRFYLFAGYDRKNVYDEQFWIQDIINLFGRIAILRKYNMLGYVMRYKKVYDSPFVGVYSAVAGWCNQPHLFRKKSCRDVAVLRGGWHRAVTQFEKQYPYLAGLFDMGGDGA